jgi:hypothetical protein
MSTDVERDRRPSSASSPAYCNAAHNVGKIVLSVTNTGTIGTSLSVTGSAFDCFTGERIPSCEYPKGSRLQYLFGGSLWIGAVIGEDTLVSTGADGWNTAGNEFHPDESGMIYRSTLNPGLPGFEDAVSEQDYVAVYYDTCTVCSGITTDPVDYRPHIPLNLKVTQESFAWSYPQAEDFVLFNYALKNIGSETINDLYLGVYVDGDVHAEALVGEGAQDDITGYLQSAEAFYLPEECAGDAEVNLAWIADNDGDLGQPVYPYVPDVTGLRVIRTPLNNPDISYNWWISNGYPPYDFGPQKKTSYRDFGTGGLGTPVGDRNKYHVLRNGEFDYDQIRVATTGINDTTWVAPPPGPVYQWADGMDTRYLLSCGPFDLEPGQEVPLVLAYVAGEGFHSVVDNLSNLPDNPDAYYDNVDFSDLAKNAVWADWIYDNPGVDTDGDGYFGEYVLCGESTTWVKGDGVPDWRAAAAPEAPAMWLEAEPSAIRVRWNGHNSETGIDWFSRVHDFEGYHAYLSTSGASGDFVRIAGYDIEDYVRYRWDAALHEWSPDIYPFSIGDLRCRYASGGCDDQSWHPLDYTREVPFIVSGTDSVLYFEPLGPNSCVFGLETPFLKRYPLAPKPPYATPEDVPTDSVAFYLTDDGYFKYYEYQFLIDGLLPGTEYWVSMAAYDFGSVSSPGVALESKITDNMASAVPLTGTGACCVGRIGNVNCSQDDTPSIGDVMELIDHVYISGAPLCCVSEADINQSGGVSPTEEDISLADIMALIDYLFISQQPTPECLQQ